MKGKMMLQSIRVCALGAILVVSGCNASKSEIGAAKEGETPKVDQADMQKKMMESYEKMGGKGKGAKPAPPPGAEKKD